MFSNLTLTPNLKGLSVTKRSGMIYGALCTCAIGAMYALFGMDAAIVTFCIGVCGFILMDVILEHIYHPPVKMTRRWYCASIAGVSIAGIAFCIYTLTQLIL